MSSEPTASEATVADLDANLLRVIDRDLADVRAHHLADGVWCLQLTLPYPLPKSVNAVLLDTEDGKLLVDSGNLVGLGWPGLERALELAGSSPEEVGTLFLTHLHPDHAEMAPTFVERTGARLLRGEGPDTATDLIHERTVPLAERRAIARHSGVPAEHLRLMVDETVADHGAVAAPPGGCRARRRRRPRDPIRDLGADPGQGPLGQPVRALRAPPPLADRRRHRLRRRLGRSSNGATRRTPTATTWSRSNGSASYPSTSSSPATGRPTPNPPNASACPARRPCEWGRGALEGLAPGPRTAYEVVLSMVGDNPDPDVRQSALSSVRAALDHLIAADSVSEDESGEVTLYELTAAGRAGGEPA